MNINKRFGIWGLGHGAQRKMIFLFFAVCLLFSVTGCEAFVKKFTRKPKEDKKEEMVLVPEDYKESMTAEERYRQYFLFWKSWQDELSISLLEDRSLKKRIDCAQQAIKNLEEMRKMLNDEGKQQLFDKYLDQAKRLRDLISGDIYGAHNEDYSNKSESIKRNVVRYFTYSEIKDYIIK